MVAMLLRCSQCSAKSVQQNARPRGWTDLRATAATQRHPVMIGRPVSPPERLRDSILCGSPGKEKATSPGRNPQHFGTRKRLENSTGGRAPALLRRIQAEQHRREKTGKIAAPMLQHRRSMGAGGQPMCRPPLSEKSAPVEKPDSSEASQAQIEAISFGSPRRLTGIVPMILSSTSCRIAFTMSVAI